MSLRFSTVSMAAVGECMLELSEVPQVGEKPLLQMGFGGDTLNTALYAARLGVTTHYVTALGDDPRSQWLIAQWQQESIQTDCVYTLPERQPGLYWITTDSQGERSFAYWRGESAARFLLSDDARLATLSEQLAQVGLVYLSGITLSLYTPEDRERLWHLLETLRAQGVVLAFDGNYRPRGWADPADARAAFSRAASLCHIVMPTFDDEVLLFGDSHEQATIDRLVALGVQEVVLKRGDKGCLVMADGSLTDVPTPRPVKPVDTTAAGDSFNGAYLASRLTQHSPVASANAGNQLAGTVILHRGAIIPKHAMPALV